MGTGRVGGEGEGVEGRDEGEERGKKLAGCADVVRRELELHGMTRTRWNDSMSSHYRWVLEEW